MACIRAVRDPLRIPPPDKREGVSTALEGVRDTDPLQVGCIRSRITYDLSFTCLLRTREHEPKRGGAVFSTTWVSSKIWVS